MPSLLTQLIHDARGFLGELSDNNDKAWWDDNKERYEKGLKAPAKQLLDELCGPLGRLTGQHVTPKLFRPHRDVRFSNDKSPYHTHLHLLWSPAYTGPLRPAYFFGVSPDYVTFGAGQPDFDKIGLAAWRRAIDAGGAHFEDIMNGLSTGDYRISEPGYKRVPAPYDKDHPRALLLRRKGLSAWRDHDAGLTRDQMMQGFERLTPMVISLGNVD